MSEENIARLARRLREQEAVINELHQQCQALKEKVTDKMVMVPMMVHVPIDVYHALKSKAEENGQPALELASLWLWRAVREF